jgi:hypothetical protein
MTTRENVPVQCSTGIYFYAPMTKSRRGGGHINLPLFVRLFFRPDIDTCFVQLSPPTVLELQL